MCACNFLHQSPAFAACMHSASCASNVTPVEQHSSPAVVEPCPTRPRTVWSDHVIREQNGLASTLLLMRKWRILTLETLIPRGIGGMAMIQKATPRSSICKRYLLAACLLLHLQSQHASLATALHDMSVSHGLPAICSVVAATCKIQLEFCFIT